MTHRCSTIRLLATLAMGLAGTAAWAQGPEIPLDLHIQPQLFESEFVTGEGEELQAATVGSGLGLNLSNSLFDFDLDYRLQSQLKAEEAGSGEDLSQQFQARLHSNVLNEAFGVDAGINTDSYLTQGGDAYRYQVTPGVKRALNDLANLSLNYEYVLDKPSAEDTELEQRGYGVTLDGSLDGGRLNWSGSWHTASVEEERSLLTRFTEVFDLKSSYQLAKSLLLELSSEFRQERFHGVSENLVSEERYGAAVSWAPSRQYSVAFKVNNHNNEATNQQETFGSGSISWLPRRNLEFTLDYGDQLVEGASGWVLHTRFDLEG